MAPSLLAPFFLPVTLAKGYVRLCLASISLAIEATKLVGAALTLNIVESGKKRHNASVQTHKAFSSRPAVKDVSLPHISSIFSTSASSASSTHTASSASVSLSIKFAAKSDSEPAVVPFTASLAASPDNSDSHNASSIATPGSPTVSARSSSSTSSSTSITSSRSKAEPPVTSSPCKAPRLLPSSASRTKTIALEHALTAAVAEGRLIDGELYYAAQEHVLARVEVEEPHERRTELARTFTPVYPAGSFEAAEELRTRNFRLTERVHSLLNDYLDSHTADPNRKPKEQTTPRLAGTVVDLTVYSTLLVNLSSIRRSLGRESKRIARRPGFHLSSPLRREVLEWAAVDTARDYDSIICVDSSIDVVDASSDDSEIDETEKVNLNEEGVQAVDWRALQVPSTLAMLFETAEDRVIPERPSSPIPWLHEDSDSLTEEDDLSSPATIRTGDCRAEADDEGDEDDEEYFRNPPVFPAVAAQVPTIALRTDKHLLPCPPLRASAAMTLDWSTETFDDDDEYFRYPPVFC
ncbi:hypothetical protein Rhopal_000965-T1 [Rhodotorula paludigena]|uniref:Uncharacterized protein n=1 Tax=Rhodotorula paludigena TaxID=86838 RepID=A0AAV5G6E9_9BASI|nr:hypothetical protein Rhopal_000965-T1 [Rhodotorula paludigena]